MITLGLVSHSNQKITSCPCLVRASGFTNYIATHGGFQMKAKLFVPVGLLFAAGGVFAADAPRVSGAIWNGQAQLMRVDFTAAPGKSARITAAAEHTLQVPAAKSGASIIRLLDSSGHQLHSATTPGRTVAAQSFGYVLCGTRVSYISPEPADIPSCPKD